MSNNVRTLLKGRDLAPVTVSDPKRLYPLRKKLIEAITITRRAQFWVHGKVFSHSSENPLSFVMRGAAYVGLTSSRSLGAIHCEPIGSTGCHLNHFHFKPLWVCQSQLGRQSCFVPCIETGICGE